MKECTNCKEPFEALQARLNQIANRISNIQRTNPDEVFFDNQEFIQVMNICKRTAQEWRLNNVIGYSQIGNKFYYKLSDILRLLEQTYKPSKF